MAAETFQMPDTLRLWPWPRAINPLHLTAQAQSMAWLDGLLGPNSKISKVSQRGKYGLLAALCHPEADLYDLRSCCDYINATFALDDFTDRADVDASTVRGVCNAILEAIDTLDVPRPAGENMAVELIRQFWLRASRDSPETTKKRFVSAFAAYIAQVMVQADKRDNAYVDTIANFMHTRRENAGCKPIFVLIEACMKLDSIPEEVMNHPALASLINDACDLIAIDNDLVSYRKEYLAGDTGYNIVAVMMAEKGVELQEAVDLVASYHAVIAARFLRTRDDVLQHANGVPSTWGERTDTQVARFIEGLGQWVRGNADWSFESGRYFGEHGLEVQRSRVVTLA